MNKIYVTKSNGTQQLFSEEKLRNSLEFTGADANQIENVLNFVDKQIYDGITTRTIYKLAFKELRKISRPLSAYYGTKRALMELGPDGFLFEKFIARIFSHLGYQTNIGVWIEGKCIGHEIDVLAENGEKKIMVECKFHNSKERTNDVKTALYIKARANDIAQGTDNQGFDEFWFVSNTSFSDDAIRYSTCSGLYLWGANFPPQNTLQDTIRDNGLNPITCLSTLKKHEKQMLLDSDILITADLLDNQSLLYDIGLEKNRAKKVMHEINKLSKRKNP